MPTVSVIIPIYNGARYISQTIDSILAQSYSDFEIIVVDDGSTDYTAEVLGSYQDRIKYIYQENRGVSTAQNVGNRHANGDYIIFCGADDLLHPQQLAVQTRALDEAPHVGLVASGFQYIDDQGVPIGEVKPWLARPDITIGSIFFGGLTPPVAVMLRRCWFDRVDGFDPGLAYSEDSDLWMRLALAGCIMVWEPQVVSSYRIHSSNMSRSPKLHFNNHRAYLDKIFADSRLPIELKLRKPERYALAYLLEASRLLYGGWDNEAHDRILDAINTNPGLLENNGFHLAEMAISLQSDVWSDGRFKAFVQDMMKERLPDFDRTLDVVSAKKQFHIAYIERNPKAVRHFWLKVARCDPHWLFNRGGWSIFVQSLAGFRPIVAA